MMRKTILKFGVLAGIIISALLIFNTWLWQVGVINFDNSMVVGYASMLVALSMVFLGVRSYRNNYCGGEIPFGKAFGVGILMVLVASLFYVVTWEIFLAVNTTVKDTFMDQYTAHSLATMQANGATAAELAEAKQEYDKGAELYQNPFFRLCMTFVEIFPVGLLVALISAAVLRIKTILPA